MGQPVGTQTWLMGSLQSGGRDLLVEEENPQISVICLRGAIIRAIFSLYPDQDILDSKSESC